MLAKLAILIQNKVALAILGTLLVAGSGTAVALAATNRGQNTLTHQSTSTSHAQQGDQQGHDAENENEAENEGELKGTVDSVGDSWFTVKMDDGSTETVTVSDETKFEDIHGLSDLMTGMEVEVKGSMESDDTFAATSVEVSHEGESENEHNGGDAGSASRSGSGTRGGSGSGSGGHGGTDDGGSHG